MAMNLFSGGFFIWEMFYISMPNSKKYTFFENDFILEFKEEHLVPQGYSTQFQQTGQNEGKKTV